MSRNNQQNIKKHNDKLHNAKAKAKQEEMERKEKLKRIVQKYKESKDTE